jgi:hypothetical protein
MMVFAAPESPLPSPPPQAGEGTTPSPACGGGSGRGRLPRALTCAPARFAAWVMR